LYLSLQGKKDTIVSSATPMVVEFNRLVGVDKVSNELGSKNLVIKFKDYRAADIERVSYDIENEEFKLTIIPKAGFSAPKEDQILYTRSGVGSDTIILIGGVSEANFSVLASDKISGGKILHFGTRVLETTTNKNILSFARPASSLSELVAQIIGECNLVMNPDVATNLIAGIEEGSQGFSGEEVTADTFQIFGSLMRVGGQRTSKTVLTGNFPMGSIPGDIPQEVPPAPEKTPSDWLEPKIYKGTTVS